MQKEIAQACMTTNNNNNDDDDFYTESTKWLFACTLKAIKTNILEIYKCANN